MFKNYLCFVSVDDDEYDDFCRYHECGPWAGKLFCFVVAMDYLFWRLLEVKEKKKTQFLFYFSRLARFVCEGLSRKHIVEYF